MTFRQLFLALRARWRITLVLFLGIVGASIAVFMMSTKLYTAAATVVVDSKADPVGGGAYATQMSTGYISTQVDIISSPRVAQRVVRLLKMDQAADSIQSWRDSTGGQGDLSAWLGAKLQKTLSVTPSRDSSVIEIAVTWTDPATAAILANAFAQAYFDTDIELKVEPARQYASWFDERSRALRADLEDKQRRLAEYQAKTGIVATDGRLDIENARLNELSSQLVSIQALRQESESRQHQINGDPQSMPEVLQSPVIAGLKSDLSRAEGKLQDVATNLGKNHPDYQNQAAEVAALKARITDESARIAASLGNNTQVMLRRENEIRAALEAQKKRMWDMTHQHDEATGLQNDVATAQRNLDTVTQRLAQSNLESQTEQTNVVLLTKAVPPLVRSSPRLSIDLLLGVLLGGIVSVGTAVFLEMNDRRLREDSELVELSGVPLFGSMPHIKPETRNPRAPPVNLGHVEPSAI
jgi:chain length determinant protein EpsF